MAKETRSTGKSLVTLVDGVLTVNLVGREGTVKTKLEGHSATQQYMPIGGIVDPLISSIAIKVVQREGLDLPAFSYAIPADVKWNEFPNQIGGSTGYAKFTVATEPPAEVTLRRRTHGNSAEDGDTVAPVPAPVAPKPVINPIVLTAEQVASVGAFAPLSHKASPKTDEAPAPKKARAPRQSAHKPVDAATIAAITAAVMAAMSSKK